MKPLKGSASDTNVVLEAVKEDVVINCIKCSREVKKDEEGGGAVVRGHQVICNSDESCPCAVGGAETRLEFFIQIIEFKMVVELNGNNSFKSFGDEGEVGDGSVI